MKSLYKKYILIVSSMVLLIASCSTSSATTPVAPATLVSVPISTAVPTSTPQDDKTSQLAPDLAYPLLLERAKRSDPNLDFTNLRWTYAKTAGYDPYNSDESDKINSMYDAFNNNNYELAVELANQILDDNYLLPDPHLVLLQAYQKLGDQQNADFHNYFLRGLITSISELGNGRSPETAFIVIQFEEESFMLDLFGIQNAQQSFKEENGIPYDIFEGVDQSTNEKVTIYFNISIPFQWLNKSQPQGQQAP